MKTPRRPWHEELAIIDRTMRAISGVTDPEEMVRNYWTGIGELISIEDFVSVSRRDLAWPEYRITRSSRFTEHHNPWTQRDRLPRFSGGLLAEFAYANRPTIIDDLPARLTEDEPARFYLEGFQSAVALPQYDGGEGLNLTVMLFPPGVEIDRSFIPMMHWQAGLFGRGTTNLVLRNELTAVLEALNRELEVVGEIQRSLLPRDLPQIEGFELATFYQTSARAGGDYYDFFPLACRQWGLFIADVAGHGTPAAVLMAITHAIAHAQPGTHTPPSVLLGYLNDQLTRSYTRDGTFVTAFYAVLDPSNRRLTYARAGHNPPRLVRRGCVRSLDETGALPMGILENQAYGQATVCLEPGDLVLLYTDGITEASPPPRNGERELFGVERLDDLLLACGANNAAECIERVRGEVAAFCANAPPIDDQTLIAIRCLK
jgi:sigma-B regulation protein RsbU (phosphoserine phosphatase)